jgi:hypothetical protein
MIVLMLFWMSHPLLEPPMCHTCDLDLSLLLGVAHFLDRSSLRRLLRWLPCIMEERWPPFDSILPIFGWDVLSLGRILYMWHNYLDSLCIF